MKKLRTSINGSCSRGVIFALIALLSEFGTFNALAAESITVDGKAVAYGPSAKGAPYAEYGFDIKGFRNTYTLNCEKRQFLWTSNIRIANGETTHNSDGAEWKPLNADSAVSNAVFAAICPKLLAAQDAASERMESTSESAGTSAQSPAPTDPQGKAASDGDRSLPLFEMGAYRSDMSLAEAKQVAGGEITCHDCRDIFSTPDMVAHRTGPVRTCQLERDADEYFAMTRDPSGQLWSMRRSIPYPKEVHPDQILAQAKEKYSYLGEPAKEQSRKAVTCLRWNLPQGKLGACANSDDGRLNIFFEIPDGLLSKLHARQNDACKKYWAELKERQRQTPGPKLDL
jgi:hypothetical protein